jgi:D-threo-aldose 1-dehydrogenase
VSELSAEAADDGPRAGPGAIGTAAIGTRGLRVPRLGVGTVPLGNMLGEVGIVVDDAEAMRIIATAHRTGARLVDTAPQYGAGLAERRVGAGVARLPRNEMVISTKVGRLLRPVSTLRKVGGVLKQSVTGPERGPALIGRHAMRFGRRLTGKDPAYGLGYPFDRGDERALEAYFDFSYDGVMRSVDDSLRRMEVDRIDMLLVHDPDDHHDEALDGAFKALDRLRGEGSVRAIGVGMNQSAMLARFAREADFDCFLLAGRYTLLNQSGLADLLPVASERRMSVMLGGVFNSGLLADPRPGVAYDYHAIAADAEPLQRALRMKAVCARHGVPLAAAALQFPLAHPAVSTVLVGVRSAAELEENVRHFTTPIPRDLWLELRAEGHIPAGVPLPGDAPAGGE